MKKILIGLLIIGNIFVVSGCGNNNATSNSNSASEETQQVSDSNNNNSISSNQLDTSKDKPDNKDLENKSNVNSDSKTTDLNNKDVDYKKDTSKTNNTKDSTLTSNNSHNNSQNKQTQTKTTNTPSSNNIVEDRVKENTKNNESDKDSMAKYYGTWRIDKVIGHTNLSTDNKTPLNKTLVITKDKYINNAFNIEIDNPKYLIATVSAKEFCKGYNMTSLKGTGLNEGSITALDITSSTNPNSDFDELYIQDGYLVYLQDGVFFKCTNQ